MERFDFQDSVLGSAMGFEEMETSRKALGCCEKAFGGTETQALISYVSWCDLLTHIPLPLPSAVLRRCLN